MLYNLLQLLIFLTHGPKRAFLDKPIRVHLHVTKQLHFTCFLLISLRATRVALTTMLETGLFIEFVHEAQGMHRFFQESTAILLRDLICFVLRR